MISIIEEHNLLTGYRFVIVEYLLVGLLVGLLGSWYAVAGRPLDAAIWLGIAVNSAVIVLLADAQLRSGVRDFGSLPFRRAAFRREVLASHGGLWRRTTLLIVIYPGRGWLVWVIAGDHVIPWMPDGGHDRQRLRARYTRAGARHLVVRRARPTMARTLARASPHQLTPASPPRFAGQDGVGLAVDDALPLPAVSVTMGPSIM